MPTDRAPAVPGCCTLFIYIQVFWGLVGLGTGRGQGSVDQSRGKFPNPVFKASNLVVHPTTLLAMLVPTSGSS